MTTINTKKGKYNLKGLTYFEIKILLDLIQELYDKNLKQLVILIEKAYSKSEEDKEKINQQMYKAKELEGLLNKILQEYNSKS